MPLVDKITLQISRLRRLAPAFTRTQNIVDRVSRVVRCGPIGVEWLSGQTAAGPIIALLPSADILILAIDLPAQRKRDRVAALPWAIEDMIADPISSLHFVLGSEISPQRYQVAAVRHDLMREWRASLDLAGLTGCRMIPEAFALPVSTEGSWSVAVDQARILVHGDDVTAFSVSDDIFPVAWESAGRPPIEIYGNAPLPESLSRESIAPYISSFDDRRLNSVLDEGAARGAIDLAQGLYAPEGNASISAVRRTAGVLGIGVIACTAVFAADTAAISHLADRRTAEAARMHAEIFPAGHRSGSVAADIVALARMGGPSHGAFLPLLSKASAALRQFNDEVSLHTLSFSAEDSSLTFGIQVKDFAALQRVESALVGAGITVETGAAAAAAGGVEAKIKLRDIVS